MDRERSDCSRAGSAQTCRLAWGVKSEGDADAAWRLYELAAFYLGADDPRKHRFIDAMSRSFDEAHRGLALTRHAVPYRGG